MKNKFSNRFNPNYDRFPLFTAESMIDIKITYDLVSMLINLYLQNYFSEGSFTQRSKM